jgi:hypothetical protein
MGSELALSHWRNCEDVGVPEATPVRSRAHTPVLK